MPEMTAWEKFKRGGKALVSGVVGFGYGLIKGAVDIVMFPFKACAAIWGAFAKGGGGGGGGGLFMGGGDMGPFAIPLLLAVILFNPITLGLAVGLGIAAGLALTPVGHIAALCGVLAGGANGATTCYDASKETNSWVFKNPKHETWGDFFWNKNSLLESAEKFWTWVSSPFRSKSAANTKQQTTAMSTPDLAPDKSLSPPTNTLKPPKLTPPSKLLAAAAPIKQTSNLLPSTPLPSINNGSLPGASPVIQNQALQNNGLASPNAATTLPRKFHSKQQAQMPTPTQQQKIQLPLADSTVNASLPKQQTNRPSRSRRIESLHDLAPRLLTAPPIPPPGLIYTCLNPTDMKKTLADFLKQPQEKIATPRLDPISTNGSTPVAQRLTTFTSPSPVNKAEAAWVTEAANQNKGGLNATIYVKEAKGDLDYLIIAKKVIDDLRASLPGGAANNNEPLTITISGSNTPLDRAIIDYCAMTKQPELICENEAGEKQESKRGATKLKELSKELKGKIKEIDSSYNKQETNNNADLHKTAANQL